jgi:hypothetical protein
MYILGFRDNRRVTKGFSSNLEMRFVEYTVHKTVFPSCFTATKYYDLH